MDWESKFPATRGWVLRQLKQMEERTIKRMADELEVAKEAVDTAISDLTKNTSDSLAQVAASMDAIEKDVTRLADTVQQMGGRVDAATLRNWATKIAVQSAAVKGISDTLKTDAATVDTQTAKAEGVPAVPAHPPVVEPGTTSQESGGGA